MEPDKVYVAKVRDTISYPVCWMAPSEPQAADAIRDNAQIENYAGWTVEESRSVQFPADALEVWDIYKEQMGLDAVGRLDLTVLTKPRCPQCNGLGKVARLSERDTARVLDHFGCMACQQTGLHPRISHILNKLNSMDPNLDVAMLAEELDDYDRLNTLALPQGGGQSFAAMGVVFVESLTAPAPGSRWTVAYGEALRGELE